MVCELIFFLSLVLTLYDRNTLTTDSTYEQQRPKNYEVEQNSFSIEIPERFEISQNIDVEIESPVFVGPHKMHFKFICHEKGVRIDQTPSCADIIDNARFFADSQYGNRTVLRISYKGECLGQNLKPDVLSYVDLKLEFPRGLFALSEAGEMHELSFITTREIIFGDFVLPNNIKTVPVLPADFQARLKLTDSTRFEILKLSNKPTYFQCLLQRKMPVLVDISQSQACPKLVGRIRAFNLVTLQFEALGLSEAEKPYLESYEKDLQFSFVGVLENGETSEGYALTADSKRINFNGKPLNGNFLLPSGLEIPRLTRLKIINNMQTLCEFEIPLTVAEVSGKAVEGIDYYAPDRPAPNILNMCTPFHQQTTNEPFLIIDFPDSNPVGSAVATSCSIGYTLYPKDSVLECSRLATKGHVDWVPRSKINDMGFPVCIKKNETCDGFCLNAGKCHVDDKNIPICHCVKNIGGFRCEYTESYLALFKIDISACHLPKISNGYLNHETDFLNPGETALVSCSDNYFHSVNYVKCIKGGKLDHEGDINELCLTKQRYELNHRNKADYKAEIERLGKEERKILYCALAVVSLMLLAVLCSRVVKMSSSRK